MFNITSFLSDTDFDYLAETKHAAEEAIGWCLLPQNVVFRMEKLTPVQTKPAGQGPPGRASLLESKIR